MTLNLNTKKIIMKIKFQIL